MTCRPPPLQVVLALASSGMLSVAAQGACPGDINGDLRVDAADLCYGLVQLGWIWNC